MAIGCANWRCLMTVKTTLSFMQLWRLFSRNLYFHARNYVDKMLLYFITDINTIL
jgi:hypothetical protein